MESKEVWILGATGRVGRAVATELATNGLSLVLVGRNENSLRELALTIPNKPRVLVSESLEATAKEITQSQPAVVVNTIGPFGRTALLFGRACLPGSHYVDVSNEILPVTQILALHDEAVAAGKTFVTGAAWGVLGTESVTLKLCENQPPAKRVRVDAIPMLKDGGVIGEALAATIIDSFVTGGQRYAYGQLEPARVGGDFESFTLPGGAQISTVGAPIGELAAARNASGASFAVAGTSEVPSSYIIRAMLPAVSAILWLPLVANAAKRQLARVTFTPPVREASWARARVEWPDGVVKEGWLRAGDAMAFSIQVASRVVSRLMCENVRPGAFTPGALFGPELAVEAGGEFVLDQQS